MNITKPKPRRERARLEVIKRDPRLQLRSYPNGATFDDAYVLELLQLLEAGTEFEPVELVEEVQKNKEPTLWLLDGFNRSAAYELAGRGLVDAIIYPGTFADAQLWALSSNSRHGRPRTPEDCRKAFDRLVSSAAMMEQVRHERQKHGGMEKALAAACGISHGAVGKYLKDMGVHPDRLTGRLVPNDGPASPEREARVALVAEATAAGKTQAEIAQELGVCPQTVRYDQQGTRRKKGRPKKPAAPNLARAGENRPAEPERAAPEQPTPTAPVGEDSGPLGKIAKLLHTVEYQMQLALKDPRTGHLLRNAARALDIPFARGVVENEKFRGMFDKGDKTVPIHVEQVECDVWPALQKIQAAVVQVVCDLAADAAQAGFGVGD